MAAGLRLAQNSTDLRHPLKAVRLGFTLTYRDSIKMTRRHITDTYTGQVSPARVCPWSNRHYLLSLTLL
jgi:hypothetical protein